LFYRGGRPNDKNKTLTSEDIWIVINVKRVFQSTEFESSGIIDIIEFAVFHIG